MTDESKVESLKACTVFVGFVIVLVTMPDWLGLLVDLVPTCR